MAMTHKKQKPTKAQVLAELDPWFNRSLELFEDCRGYSPLAQERIAQLEVLRDLAREAGLDNRHMRQIQYLLTELSRIKVLSECTEAGGSGLIQ
ncbi:MAG: hypothetical protein FJW35_14130 [Acidobacteria bacterium]|nr:hypothetical protein [Acidobacteriota bacterium]